MGGGGAGSCNRNVRKGREIVEREALGMEIRSEAAVRDSGLDSDGLRGGVERHNFLHRAQREKVLRAVSDGVEAVASAEDLELLVGFNEGLHLAHGGGGIKIVSAVDNVSGPVGELPGPGEQRGDGGLEDERGEELEEGSLFHIFGDGRTV